MHARQAAKANLLRYQEPLFAIAGEVPPVEEWPLKSDATTDAGDQDEIAGAAGSPGVATGRARVVMDAYADDPTEPGEVLVAPITDPGWLPLFVGAVAVVTEMGGELEPHDDRLARSRDPRRRRRGGRHLVDQDR